MAKSQVTARQDRLHAGTAVLLVGLLCPAVAPARISEGEICDQAARIAAERTGVPLSVLQAITRTETGQSKAGRFVPWPWTVNMEGKGVWFDTLDEARAYVFRNFKRGARSFDVGCFQINYKWHHKGFSSIDDMFDPVTNATYAARFLGQLHAELGSWSDAAGAYHSRTPKLAERYKTLFERHRRIALGNDALPASDPPRQRTGQQRIPRNNKYPFLQDAEDASGMSPGSLVPLAGVAALPGGFLDLGKRSGG